MWSSDCDRELPVAAAASADDSSSTTSSTKATPPPSPPPAATLSTRRRRRTKTKKSNAAVPTPPRDAEADSDAAPEPEVEDVWRGAQWEAAWPSRHPKPVVLAEEDDGAVGRSRSLTDDDLEELKGCADLGFGFSYDEIPELRDTLPALELCYSMSQRLLDDQPAAEAPPVTNWKISSPGDSPDEVKARLKYWAQAVACTVRLCS